MGSNVFFLKNFFN